MMMATRMKRKELEEVNDEFSDFSLSSPARKIRRLDAELPPIMEEEEPEIFPVSYQSIMSQENVGEVRGDSGRDQLITKELPQKNEERAIVLFKSMNSTPFPQPPSAFSVSSDILARLKNKVPWSNQSKLLKTSADEAEQQDKILEVSNECLAVVPWVQSQLPHAQGTLVEQRDVTEMMEGEEMDTTSMDIEDNCTGIEQRPGSEFGGTSSSEGVHQWQQHCMMSQFPQNASPPIVWFRSFSMVEGLDQESAACVGCGEAGLLEKVYGNCI